MPESVRASADRRMANNGTLASVFPTGQHHCKDCGLFFESGKSLEVHLQYHKENLLSKWATQAQSAQNDLENNNNTKIKREASADSSDTMITKPSPEFPQRATPETAAPFGHPATPQSYHSAPSPYQTPEPAGFSPGQFPYGPPAFVEGQWEHQGQYAPEFPKAPRFHPYPPPTERSARVSSSSPLYGQPLNQPTPSPSPKQCDKCGFVCDSAAQLSEHCSTSHPPTPRGSHFHHPQGYPQKHYVSFAPETEAKIKEEQEESADILDLDSQKVVHPGGDENGPFDGNVSQMHHNGPNPHPVSAMLPWPEQKMYGHHQINGEPKMFPRDQKMFIDQKPFAQDQKMYPHEVKHYPQDQKLFPSPQDQKNFIHHDQKLYQPHQMSMGEYQSGVSTSGREIQPPYRPFDSSTGPQISSTQATNTSNSAPSISGKGANWKSNEARRPKTYNCTACNKWFTSSGHLKRHYNTTLHKNAVRSSGQPDPATLPISTHHHPTRDPNHGSRGQQSSSSDPNTQSPLSSDDVRSPDDGHGSSQFPTQSFDRSQHPGMGPSAKSSYMHQQPNLGNNQLLGNNPLANHPLPHQMGSHPLAMGNPPPGLGNPLDTGHHLQSLKPASQPSSVTNSVGSPPNGQAGPSVQTNHLSRGLLSISTSNTTVQPLPQVTPPIMAHSLPPFSHLPGNPYSPRPSDHQAHTLQDPTHTAIYLGQNFQQTLGPNYPNAMSPHVMDMASNNLPTTNPVTIGEIASEQFGMQGMEMQPSGPLPSFSQFQSHRYGIIMPNYSPMHNVGGNAPGDSPPIQSYMTVLNPSNNYVHASEYLDESSVDTGDTISQQGYNLTTLDSMVMIKREFNSLEDLPLNKREIYSMQDLSSIKRENYSFVDMPTIKRENFSIHEMPSIKLDVPLVSNKENYESQVSSPSSPVSLKLEYENNGSPSISSTVPGPPLSSSNKQASKTGAPEIHKCFECDKLFNKACYLTQHNKSFHSGAKPFKCVRCGKRFPNDASYEEHYSKHAGDKPFKCELCPKQFNHKTDLRRHMCLHTGEKPFSCAECGKGFIRKDHMLKHCDTHRKKTNSA